MVNVSQHSSMMFMREWFTCIPIYCAMYPFIFIFFQTNLSEALFFWFANCTLNVVSILFVLLSFKVSELSDKTLLCCCDKLAMGSIPRWC